MSKVLPELSIIIPTLNESAELQLLFANLADQKNIHLEVILCDGGSCDDTPVLAASMAATHQLETKIIQSPPGRGKQMNQGAAAASADLLLFLHADCRLMNEYALRKAVDAFKKFSLDGKTHALAARFELIFHRESDKPSLAYFFYESKARLNRLDCIRGDQGFLLNSSFFKDLGGFDISLPFLEDIRLAALIQQLGNWQLLPVKISTSARRFEAEGLCRRQILNAIIVNNLEVGWTDFFNSPKIYCNHSSKGKLLLHPLLENIRIGLAARPAIWQFNFWLATGRHVSSNIWQLLFWLDVRRDYKSHNGSGSVNPRWLAIYQRCLERFTANRLASIITALAVWIWFRVLLIKTRIFETS